MDEHFCSCPAQSTRSNEKLGVGVGEVWESGSCHIRTCYPLPYEAKASVLFPEVRREPRDICVLDRVHEYHHQSRPSHPYRDEGDRFRGIRERGQGRAFLYRESAHNISFANLCRGRKPSSKFAKDTAQLCVGRGFPAVRTIAFAHLRTPGFGAQVRKRLPRLCCAAYARTISAERPFAKPHGRSESSRQDFVRFTQLFRGLQH